MLLVDFSLEILDLICSELDAYSAVACGRACRVLHHVITTLQPIQYTITLGMRGMRAGRNESIDIGERLKMLERYETAWLEGVWEESYRIAIPENDDDPAEQFRLRTADGYILMWSFVTGKVRAVRLPSPLRGISLEEHRWQFTPPPPDRYRAEIDMLLDAQNDVVMFVELARVDERGALGRKVTLHRFELSSGNTPDFASATEIVILAEHNLSSRDLVLRNEFIIMRFQQGTCDQGIMVYNWVTQRKILHITTFDLLATFLDDKRIVVGFFRAEALEPGTDPRLRVYDLSALNADGSAQATHEFPLPFRPNFSLKGRNCIGRECGRP
ncbi:hypothetical protein PENSPDRAFT_753644 [Peniophora sp. CONT]|nr:hypothetical protein PENSPDRAFT_753644 [Peniophora sp. CONT]